MGLTPESPVGRDVTINLIEMFWGFMFGFGGGGFGVFWGFGSGGFFC